MERHKLTSRPKAAPNRRQLNDVFIRGVAAPPKTRLWWDTQQGGLALQVTPTGHKSFKCVYRHAGRVRWFHIDSYPSIGLKEARDIALQIRSRAALGEDPHSDKVASRTGDTLKNVAERYVERHARRANKSWRQADHLMRRYVLPTLGSRKIQNIKRREIRQIFDQRGTASYLKRDVAALQVTPTGHKSFKCVYRHAGRVRWFHIDSYPSIGLKEARDIALQIRSRAALGEDPHSDKVASRTGDTLKNVAERYVERHARRANKSWRQADHLMRRYVLPTLGSRKIQNIKRREIRQIFDHLTEENHPIMANQVLAAVSKVLSWAEDKEIVETNVARGIRRNKTNGADRFLSDEELALVWPEFEKRLGPARAMALRLILVTAQRPGEVCAMRWQDIDLNKAVWSLPGSPDKEWPGTKNGRTHQVPLSVPALEILQELGLEESGPVFPHERGCMRIPSVQPIWKALGMQRFRPHDLRATAASGMDALGIHKEHISRVLNHVEGGTTAGYIRHDNMEQKRRALEAWALRLKAVVQDREPPSKVVPIRAG